jgi:hypothetical protein
MSKQYVVGDQFVDYKEDRDRPYVYKWVREKDGWMNYHLDGSCGSKHTSDSIGRVLSQFPKTWTFIPAFPENALSLLRRWARGK